MEIDLISCSIVDDELLENIDSETKEKKKVYKPHAKFTQEDDELLRSLVADKKSIDWYEVSLMMPGRNPRQCRERWTNYLCPTLNTSEWTQEEDNLLREKVGLLGKKWVKISRFFHNRTDQMCKNRFNILERKELRVKRGRKPGKKSVKKDESIAFVKPEYSTISIPIEEMNDSIPVAMESFFTSAFTNDLYDHQLQESFYVPDDMSFYYGFI